MELVQQTPWIVQQSMYLAQQTADIAQQTAFSLDPISQNINTPSKSNFQISLVIVW